MYSSLQNSAPRALAQALAEGRCKSKHAILLNVSRYCKGLNSPAAARPLPEWLRSFRSTRLACTSASLKQPREVTQLMLPYLLGHCPIVIGTCFASEVNIP